MQLRRQQKTSLPLSKLVRILQKLCNTQISRQARKAGKIKIKAILNVGDSFHVHTE